MRVVWKLSRSKWLLGGGLLAATSLLFFTWSLSQGSQNLNENGESDVFYDTNDSPINFHWFVEDKADPKPYQRVVEDPVEFVPNRDRILMTSYGMVVVKDLLFVPVKPLKRGQSFGTQFSDNDFNNLLLGSKAQGQDLALPQQNQDTDRFHSILQQRREGGVNEDGVRNNFLNSEKMLALQAQMRAREIESIKKLSKESEPQKKEETVPVVSWSNSTGCQKHLCAEFLTSYDLPHFRYCKKKSRVRSDREPPESQCNFINATGRSAVALASHAGSGHLLVRQLLQKSTGLCTGGVNCDVRLRRSGYPGECLRSGTVLVVKTHQTEPRWTGIQYDNSIPYKGFNKIIDIPVYSSAILLLRDPYDALADLWDKMKMEGIITDDRWNNYLFEQATEWQQIVLAWTNTNHKHPLLIVKYEDLKQDTPNVLTQILDFLQVPYSAFIVQELSLKLQVSEKVSLTYTSEERDYINSIIKSTIDTLRTNKVDTNCDLTSYLRE